GAGERGRLLATRTDPRHLEPHHLGEADQLLDGLTLHPQRGQEGGDLRVGRRARHDRLHRRGGLDAREIAPVDEDPGRFGDDRTRHAGRLLPCSRAFRVSHLSPRGRTCPWMSIGGRASRRRTVRARSPGALWGWLHRGRADLGRTGYFVRISLSDFVTR